MNTGEYGTIADNTLGNINNRVLNGVVNGTYSLSPTRIFNYRVGASRRYEGRGRFIKARSTSPISVSRIYGLRVRSEFAMFPTINAAGYAAFGDVWRSDQAWKRSVHVGGGDVGGPRTPHSEVRRGHPTLRSDSAAGLSRTARLFVCEIADAGSDPLWPPSRLVTDSHPYLMGFGTGSIRNTPALAVRNVYWALYAMTRSRWAG